MAKGHWLDRVITQASSPVTLDVGCSDCRDSAPNTTFTPNAAGVNTNVNFGRIFGALDMLRMQLGLRLDF